MSNMTVTIISSEKRSSRHHSPSFPPSPIPNQPPIGQAEAIWPIGQEELDNLSLKGVDLEDSCLKDSSGTA